MNYARILAASLCAFVAYFIYGGILFGALPWLRTEYAKYPAVYRSQEGIKSTMPFGVLAMFVKAGLVASNGEARRQIKGGGLRVNDAAVTDEKMMLRPSDLTPEGVIKLSMGKKRHVLLTPA